MDAQTIALLLFGAVLVFWAVGAYNRLARLRAELGRRFAPVAVQLQARNALLREWADALQAFLEQAPEAADELRSAGDRLLRAVEQVRPRAHQAALVAALREAELQLLATRTRLASELPVQAHHMTAVAAGEGAALMKVNEDLAAVDSAVLFTRQHFDAAVQAYNDALLQFPTVVIAGLFGFRAAATL